MQDTSGIRLATPKKRAISVFLKLITGLLFALYPFFIYLGLQEFNPRTLAGILLVIVLLRFSVWKEEKEVAFYWVLAIVAIALVSLVTGSKSGLYFYPVLINLLFLIFFLASLMRPPTIVEKIARRQDPNLPEQAIPYIRKVTWAWCLFFLVNGGIAAITVFYSQRWWLLYNGFVSYCLMGLMFLGEYLVRLRVQRKICD